MAGWAASLSDYGSLGCGTRTRPRPLVQFVFVLVVPLSASAAGQTGQIFQSFFIDAGSQFVDLALD